MPSDLDLFQRGVYDRTFDEFKSLKRKLPDETIIALAREVFLHISERAKSAKIAQSAISEAQIEKLARALISDDTDAGAEMVRQLQVKGTSLDDVYLLHLASASRKLGLWWESDRVSLVDVTIGTGRIYAIMRGLAGQFPISTRSNKKSAMFTAVPGETHTIGVKMAADLFRKKGWDIDLKLGANSLELAEAVRRDPPRIIGLSAGGMHAVQELGQLIIAVRINSPATAILVSGQIVNEAAEIVTLMGPDSLVFDFAEVEREMDRLWQVTARS